MQTWFLLRIFLLYAFALVLVVAMLSVSLVVPSFMIINNINNIINIINNNVYYTSFNSSSSNSNIKVVIKLQQSSAALVDCHQDDLMSFL